MRVKKRIFSGAVCEQLVYTIPDGEDPKKAKPQLRFRDLLQRAAHKLGISRRRFIRIVNATFTPRSYYCTLTFDMENEVHTFAEARRIRTIYRRRLQRINPQAALVIVMGRGRNTNRIHFHMLADGLTAEQIRMRWTFGNVEHCEHLRAHCYYGKGAMKRDYGQDYTGLANYLFNHWTEEQGGHRYMATATCCKPEEETPAEVKRSYSSQKPPRAPKGYKLVETTVTSYGFALYKYILYSTMAHRPQAANLDSAYPGRDYDDFGADGMPLKESLVNV